MSTRYQLRIVRITDPTPEQIEQAERLSGRPRRNDMYDGARAGDMFPIQDVLAVEVTEEQYKTIKAESIKAFI